MVASRTPASSGQGEFVFEKTRKPRARKVKPVPASITTPEGIAEPWLHDPRSYICGTVACFKPHVSGYVLPDPGGRDDTLFEPRALTRVPHLPGNYSLAGKHPKVYLPVDKGREAEMLAAGAVKGVKGGFSADPADMAQLSGLQAFTPFIAKPLTRAFQIEPIPSTAWGATLANLLTPASWERLRLRATHPHAHLCQICGEGGRKTIDVHELWTYELPSKAWTPGTQRLAGLLSLCRRCHRMFHPGFAGIMGKAGETSERIALVNRWSPAETAAYLAWAGDVWAARSKVSWMLDLSFIDGEELTVSSSAWMLLPDGRLVPKDELKRVTRIIGVKWSMSPPRKKRGSVDAGNGSLTVLR